MNSWFDIGIAAVFGILGYLMKELKYSRAAMLIGFVLGFAIEKNLYLAVQLSGPYFILDPIPLTLAIFTLAAITDWLDGYLARKQGLVSTLGRNLDPLVDKVVISGAESSETSAVTTTSASVCSTAPDCGR